jgi:hypothetical protein
MYWKARAKIRFALEGDENTKFFHSSATCRMRRNSIPSLLVDGVEITDHCAKVATLKSFYADILAPTTWRFNISSLYGDARPAHLNNPFSPGEIKNAFLGMNKLSSPGPDGFGPSFFSTFWETVAPDILALFRSFYDGSMDLSWINRAFLVLLPKIESANHPSQFRPISLQNCIMKPITKVLTTRLQSAIQTLVDVDQTGFCSGVVSPRTLSMRLIFFAVATVIKRPALFLRSISARPLTRSTGTASSSSCEPVALTSAGVSGWRRSFAPVSRLSC